MTTRTLAWGVGVRLAKDGCRLRRPMPRKSRFHAVTVLAFGRAVEHQPRITTGGETMV